MNTSIDIRKALVSNVSSDANLFADRFFTVHIGDVEYRPRCGIFSQRSSFSRELMAGVFCLNAFELPFRVLHMQSS